MKQGFRRVVRTVTTRITQVCEAHEARLPSGSEDCDNEDYSGV